VRYIICVFADEYSFFGAFWSILSCLFECAYDNVIREGLLLHQKLRAKTK